MKRPSFSEGVLVALVAAVLGSMVYMVLPGLLGPAWTIRALIAGIGLGYILYLLRRSPERTGRLVTLTGWLLVAGSSWFLVTDPPLYLAVHLGMVWLVRALYHQPGPLAALMDLALNLTALMAGLWAFEHADSVFLGIWTFFLMQALFVAVPSADGRRAGSDAGNGPQPDQFQRAYRSAEAALHKLSSHPLK
jgi:hypothetical protein